MADEFSKEIKSLSKSNQEILAANAKSQGMTAEEYLASRGGLNPVTSQFGDSYNPNFDLSDAEYTAALAGKSGLDRGKALNAARAAKVQGYIDANPDSPEAIAAAKDLQMQNFQLGLGSSNASGLKSAAQIAAEANAAQGRAERQSAYDLLLSQFKQYGLEALVEPLKGLITSGASPAEFTIRLRESDAYKKRFSANAQRVAKGLRSLSESEYIQLEDQYQDVMRRYGLPDTYYARGEMGIQEGFNKFLEGDVSPVELEDRISTAQKRVLNANPEVTAALKQFYPDITNSDILAYTLDPKNAIENIKRKVTTAEIGGAAIQAGLQTGLTRAEELRAAGITKDTAQQGFGTIAGGLQRGSQLASIYGEDPYTQTTAEKEVFGLAGQTEAAKERKKLTGLERATFSGQTGLTSGALARDRAGAY
jgi:hypothetical protein